jgi:hypothetical protein
MRTSLVLAVVIALAGCNKDSSGGSSGAGSASSATGSPGSAAAAPATSAKLTRDTIVWKWTGKFDPDGYTMVSITNNGPAALTHALLQYYFYDKNGKQLQEKQFEFYSLNIAKGATVEQGRGLKKADFPAGTDAIEIVAQRADFMGNVSMVDLSLAPASKPKGQ